MLKNSWLHSRRFKMAAVALVITCLVLFLVVRLTGNSSYRLSASDRPITTEYNALNGSSQADTHDAEDDQSRLIAADHTVLLGIQLENFYDLDLHNRSFKVDGWYWLKYPDSVKALLDKFKIDSAELIRFVNAIDNSELSINAIKALDGHADENYFRAHFSGRFHILDLRMHGFPFYRLKLPIVMESRRLYLDCSRQNKDNCVKLVFHNNRNASILGDYTDINGYEIKRVSVVQRMRKSTTDYGWRNWPVLSTVTATAEYASNPNNGFWQYIFPVVVLVGIAILSPSLQGSMGDLRIAIPPTVLLTLIFLQQSYNNILPPLAYSTYLDWLYNLSFFIAFALFCLFCWGVNLYDTAHASKQEDAALRHINRIDLIVQLSAIVCVAIFMLWGLVLGLTT